MHISPPEIEVQQIEMVNEEPGLKSEEANGNKQSDTSLTKTKSNNDVNENQVDKTAENPEHIELVQKTANSLNINWENLFHVFPKALQWAH